MHPKFAELKSKSAEEKNLEEEVVRFSFGGVPLEANEPRRKQDSFIICSLPFYAPWEPFFRDTLLICLGFALLKMARNGLLVRFADIILKNMKFPENFTRIPRNVTVSVKNGKCIRVHDVIAKNSLNLYIKRVG